MTETTGSDKTTPPPQVAALGFYPFSAHLKTLFPWKVYKITIDAGFTCPNRDGTRGVGGCAYCVNESFSPRNRGETRATVAEQMAAGIAGLRHRYGAEKFIAYFQAYTNTYADTDTLKRLYDEALREPDIVGLAVGTRPDCVDEETLALLERYTARCRVWVEYGLQSIHDDTLRRINRGHTYREFLDAVAATAGRGIEICPHVIIGLPGETPPMVLATAEALSRLPIDSLKIHHLYIARGAAMEAPYRRGEVSVLSAEQCVSLVCDFLERIPSSVYIQRLFGEMQSDLVVAPHWGLPKQRLIAMVTEEFRRRGTWQGYSSPA